MMKKKNEIHPLPLQFPNQKAMNCSICNQPIEIMGTWDQGHNAHPVNDGRCCGICNLYVVIPARFNCMTRVDDRNINQQGKKT
jgi:hypothetical protein